MEWNVSRLSVPIGHETASWSWNWNWNVPVRDRGIQYDGLASRQREVLGRQHEDLARRVVKHCTCSWCSCSCSCSCYVSLAAGESPPLALAHITQSLAMVSRPRTHRSCFRGHQTGHVQTLPSSLFPSRHLPLFSHPDPLRHKQLPTHPALPFPVTRKSHFIPIPNADFAFHSSSHTHSLPLNTIVRCRRTLYSKNQGGMGTDVSLSRSRSLNPACLEPFSGY